MLALAFLTLALLGLGEAQPPPFGKGRGSCPRLWSCGRPGGLIFGMAGPSWRAPGLTYDACKSKYSAETYKQQADCVKKGIQDTITDKECWCAPWMLIGAYNVLTSSYPQLDRMMRCLNLNDILLPGCPAAIRTECGRVAQIAGPYSGGPCSPQAKQIFQQAKKCFNTLRTSDLSKCGSVQDAAKLLLPLTSSTNLLCEGCDVRSKMQTCVQPMLMRSMMRPSSFCGIKSTVDAVAACFLSAVKQDTACSSVSPKVESMLQKAKQSLLYKPLIEGCGVEKEFNYAEKYTSWGCGSAKGKAAKRDAPPDVLHDLWSTVMQLY